MKRQAVFACDIGGSKLMCGLVTRDGQIIDKMKTPLAPDITIDALEQYILSFYHTLIKNNPDVEAVSCGMTIPGLADPQRGIWVYACFSGIKDYPIVARMSGALALPITIENDVNACAWAEKIYGVCTDCDDFLWVTVSNGVGGGLVLCGRLYEGAFGGAGEFGHIVVERDGLTCPCGHKGCMEAMAAGPAIAKRYEMQTGVWRSAADIAALAREGDDVALEVMHKTGEYIGMALGKAASLLNLRKYVLGGGVMQSFDLMRDSINEAFAREAFAAPNKNAVILPTGLRYEAGLLGAAAIAWHPPINENR